MGRASRRKWENRRGRVIHLKSDKRSKSVDVEQVDYGPIMVTRYGRLVQIEGKRTPEEHQKLIESLREERPKLRDEISRIIAELRDYIRPLNRLNLLASVCNALQLSTPENFGKEGAANFARAEYFVSLALVDPLPTDPTEPTGEDTEKVLSVLKQIFEKVTHYYGTEVAEKGDQGAISELVFRMRLQSLGVRGDAYPQHARRLSDKIVALADQYLVSEFGLTARRVQDLAEMAVRQVEKQIIEEALSVVQPMKEANADFQKWASGRKKQFRSVEDMMAAYKATGRGPSAESWKKFVGYTGGTAVSYRLIPRDGAEEKFLSAVSMGFGDNREFMDKWHGWPLSPSIVYDSPVVQHEGSFYGFMVHQLLNDLPNIVAKLLERRSPSHHRRFLRDRDVATEDLAVQLLTECLRPERVYRNLHYFPTGSPKDGAELDGLFVVGDALLILEAKAEKLTPAARRGAPDRLRDDVKDIIWKGVRPG